MKKCDYCAKEISYFEQYCDEDCQCNANKFYETTEKYGNIFSVINMICVFGITIGIFLFAFLRIPGMILTVASCTILGIMLLLLPFPTENMISKYKIQKATKITRYIGLAVIGLGIMFLIFMLLFPVIFPE